MNLYFIRHAEAEPTSDTKPHEERELTENGIHILKDSVNLWKNYIRNFEIILSSPLKRALQTVRIVKDELKTSAEVLEEISLLNGGLTEDIITLVNSLGMEDVALVGHQPDLGIHISRITGSIETNYKISPASIAKISFKGSAILGKGTLEFLLPPVRKKG